MLSAFRCFLTVSKTDDYKIFIGYWGREDLQYVINSGGNDGNYCVGWDAQSKETMFDAAWRFGRTVGIIGAIVSIVLLVFSIYILFYKIGTKFLSYMLYANISMAICTLFLLTGLSSDICAADNCKIGPGGFLAIFDFFLWLGAAFIALQLKKSSQDDPTLSNDV